MHNSNSRVCPEQLHCNTCPLCSHGCSLESSDIHGSPRASQMSPGQQQSGSHEVATLWLLEEKHWIGLLRHKLSAYERLWTVSGKQRRTVGGLIPSHRSLRSHHSLPPQRSCCDLVLSWECGKQPRCAVLMTPRESGAKFGKLLTWFETKSYLSYNSIPLTLSLGKINEISPRLKPFLSPIETLAKPSRVTDWVLALGRRASQARHLHLFGSS